MENLPTDIIGYILSRLPVESTLQSKRVCKTWRNLIGKNKTGFLFSYTNLPSKSGLEVELYYGDQYKVNLDHYNSNKTLEKLDRVKYSMQFNNRFAHHHVVGSCNGLVCLRLYNQVTKAASEGICNPVTGEFLFLPGFSETDWYQYFGFGYLPATDEYKVVRCSYNNLNPMMQGHLEVYTLGSQSGWRRKEDIPYGISSPGLFANGAIHWICKIFQGEYDLYYIIAFDLADEKLKYIPSLPFDSTRLFDSISLELLGGNLCVIHCRGHGDEIIDIWAFQKRITDAKIPQPRVTPEEYYGNNWSWIKEFSIACPPEEYDYKPFAITEDKNLYYYDNITSALPKLWDGNGLLCLQVIPHMNILVSLKDLGECCDNNVTSGNESSGSTILIAE